MQETLLNLFYVLCRYIHIVATTVIVGGTLFFEMVVPTAIGDLKNEVQLALFGRMRWVFRWVVYTCTIALLITGGVSIYRNFDVLNGKFLKFLVELLSERKIEGLLAASIFNWPKFWFIAHIVSGLLSLLIAILLVTGGRPPDRPIQWMRVNLFVLLIAIFLASASRGARQNLYHGVLDQRSALCAGLSYNRAVSDLTDPYSISEPYRIELAPGVHVASDALRIQYARSGGPGGQNVNKLNTRAEMWIHVNAITGLSDNALARLRRLAGKRLTKAGEIHIIAQTERSQERNRQAVLDRLRAMIDEARIEPKPRRPTKISRAAKRRRVDAKRRRGETKAGRSGRMHSDE